ncbi:hypothetical protein B0H19DRAFT_1316372 [Mycena capillaripes]|nr:hypothetical protein B0H19DRAFT_1316372 [Mycena capillaripes]
MASTSKLHPRSTITISPESVVELSKSVLLPFHCDTPVPTMVNGPPGPPTLAPCGQTLNCWKAFHKHQTKHCGSRKTPSGAIQYMCRLNKCSAKLHSSLTSLKSHVESSHMKHSDLPCPFTRCVKPMFPGSGRETAFTTFSRSRDLVHHLEAEHGDLIGQAVDISSSILLPRAEPFRPAKSAMILPRLPPSASIPLGSLSVDPITIYPTYRLTSLISDKSTSLPLSHSYTPKAAPRPRLHQSERTLPHTLSPPEQHSNQSHQSQYKFADLPEVEYHRKADTLTPPGILDVPRFVVRTGLPQMDLVRALPMRPWPPVDSPPPPKSIFYEVLKEQVYADYFEGKGAATDEQ